MKFDMTPAQANGAQRVGLSRDDVAQMMEKMARYDPVIYKKFLALLEEAGSDGESENRAG